MSEISILAIDLAKGSFQVAPELGETVDRLFQFASDMEPEDGVIWVYGLNDDGVMAFSPFGIENLRETIEMNRDSGN